MKHKSLIKKIKAKLGVEPQEGHNGQWYVVHDGTVISWYTRKPWDDPGGPLETNLYHVRSVGDESDPYTDYHAGSFRSNATQMINAICPPSAKFSVGSLVRGKQNKRAVRHGYAGKVGLVTKASQYMSIDWVGEEAPRYPTTYPERDIELVSAA